MGDDKTKVNSYPGIPEYSRLAYRVIGRYSRPMSEGIPKVVPIRPQPRPLKHAGMEELALQMGVYGKSASDAGREVLGLLPEESVPSKVYKWAATEDVQARVIALKNERARRAVERVVISEVEVIEGLKEVAARCMQHEEVLSRDGKPSGEYKFNAPGANKAFETLGKYLGLWDGKRGAGEDDVADMTDDQLLAAMEAGREFFEREPSEETEAGGADCSGAEEAEAAELPTVPETG